MKRAISLLLASLLLAVSAAALADPTTFEWVTTPVAGDTEISFYIDPLDSYFYHIWINRAGSSMGYFNSDGNKVPFSANTNTFSLINDTNIFTNNGFTALEDGDEINVRVGSSASKLTETISTPGPVPNPDPDPNPAPATTGVKALQAAATPTQGAVIVGVSAFVNVRTAASTDSEIVGKAFLGEAVQLMYWEGDWVRILFDGGNGAGWVHGQFVAVR